MAEATYGPRVTVTRSCADCKACETESYRCQGDSGIDYFCGHPSYEKRRPIGIFSTTPDWCPASTLDPATKGWFAALADARLAARKADNGWLVGKLDEIHQHLLPTPGVTPTRGPLTKDEVDALVYQCRQAGDDSTYALVCAVEATHGVKGLDRG